MLVHFGPHMKETGGPAVTQWLSKAFPQTAIVGDDPSYRPGIVHRLDRETSGVLLIALKQPYFLYLKSLFQTHAITKTYYALVAGKPVYKKGIIDRPIGIKSGTTKRTIHSTKMAKEAITEYECENTFTKDGFEYSLIRVVPKTGRTHQIRVHLASLGCPVLGDKLYGGRSNASRASRHMLHCFSMEFDVKKGEKIKIEAPFPDDFKTFLS